MSSTPPAVTFALIGGSGLGESLGITDGDSCKRHLVPTPFGLPSSEIVETTWHGQTVFLLKRHGEGHLLNPSAVPYRANLYALKSLGVTHILASGAVGSLREELRPRDLVIADQVIDKTFRRANTFFESAAVHVDFAQPFCPRLRDLLAEASKQVSGDAATFKVHPAGTYVCMEGPAFSTRAESLMHRIWGGDVIGMTAMPEARLAREAEMAYALVTLVTDYDCWKSRPAPSPGAPAADAEESLLHEIIGHLRAATANAMQVLKAAIALAPSRQEQLATSPALHALKLGIWSDKSRIAPGEVARLHALWGRYFDRASS
jgi:5'-methylthioadenosine phosphorylase